MRPLFEGVRDNPKRRTCMLMVTRACNLNCKYCYETYKEESYMSFETASAAIMKEADIVKHSDTFTELEIDFMGGEPLMNFTLIQQVVEWLSSNPIGVPFICFAITNGTLLTPERKEWFSKNKHLIWLGISVDGSELMTCENRGVKVRASDLEYFYKTWPEQPFHMTISKTTLPSFFEGVVWLQSKGYRLEVSLAQGVDWSVSDAIIFREQMSLLTEHYLKTMTMEPINIFQRPIAIVDAKTPQLKYCGTGTNLNTYDVDGRVYGCHMFTPVVLGGKAVEATEIDWSDLDANADERCRECMFKTICPTCPGFNFKFRSSVGKRDMRSCLMTLAEVLSVCEFQLKIIARKNGELSEVEAQYAQAAMNAWKILRNIPFPNSQAPFKMISYAQ